MNYLRDYAHSYTDERLKIKNDHKGKAYLYAIIYDRHRCYSVGIITIIIMILLILFMQKLMQYFN